MSSNLVNMHLHGSLFSFQLQIGGSGASSHTSLVNLSDENSAFLQFHAIGVPPLRQFPPAFSRLGCCASTSYVPCVLCQQGANPIDHWLSFCQVVHLTWSALWASPAPDIDWRKIPSRSTGVALCYMLFHLRRLVTEYGGLRPVITCVRIRSISNHVLDLWQRTYHSLPSTLLRHFRAPPQAGNASCLDSTKIRQRFPTVSLSLPCSHRRGSLLFSL